MHFNIKLDLLMGEGGNKTILVTQLLSNDWLAERRNVDMKQKSSKINFKIIRIAANNCGDQYVQIWLKAF